MRRQASGVGARDGGIRRSRQRGAVAPHPSPLTPHAIMTEQDFFDLARQGFNRIPVVRELPGDLETPLSV